MPRVWVAKRQAAAKNQKRAPAKYDDEALRTMPLKSNDEALRTTPFKSDEEALRSMPFKNDEALRTMPFKEYIEDNDPLKVAVLLEPRATGLSDDEDSMSTSAGSSDLGLAESHMPSFAETEEEEHNGNSEEIPRALLLLYRNYVPSSTAPEYNLRTMQLEEFNQPEVLLPPGIFPPPGLEDNFDPSQFAVFRAVATDTEELQTLLGKISLGLDHKELSSTAQAEQQDTPVQDWVFENLPQVDWSTSEVRDGSYAHLWESNTEELADHDVDYVSEWLANLAAAPLGMPLMSAQESNCGKTFPISNKDLVEALQESADPSTLFKTGWEMDAESVQSFNVAHGMAQMAAAMAWSQCYEGGLCENWLQDGTAAQESLKWYPSAWNTFW